MSIVQVGSHTHTTTYVATNPLRSLRQLLTAAGFDPGQFMSSWSMWEDGVAHWLSQRGLEDLVLEIYDPTDAINDLRGRFDFALDYSYGGDGSLWVDPDTIAFAVKKNGSYPSSCRRSVVVGFEGVDEVDGDVGHLDLVVLDAVTLHAVVDHDETERACRGDAAGAGVEQLA